MSGENELFVWIGKLFGEHVKVMSHDYFFEIDVISSVLHIVVFYRKRKYFQKTFLWKTFGRNMCTHPRHAEPHNSALASAVISCFIFTISAAHKSSWKLIRQPSASGQVRATMASARTACWMQILIQATSWRVFVLISRFIVHENSLKLHFIRLTTNWI